MAPDMPVLLIIAEGPGANLPRLAKPFRHTDLAQRIADLLIVPDAPGILRFPGRRPS